MAQGHISLSVESLWGLKPYQQNMSLVGSSSCVVDCSLQPSVHVPLVGDRYPPSPLEGKKASREALGLLSRKAIPSWARGELLVE
jgi:hypothetical protein